MEAIRTIVDRDLLNNVIPLPEYFQSKKVEVIVFPAEEKSVIPSLTMTEINEMMKGSVTESLIGVLPNRSASLDEYRAERLKKYETVD
ncbi:MAG: hypothetical protein FWD34_04005 [Oscillospiraceae bacterium]|nr:hypothetical protein [Oscillospiraceae bacterium]